MDKRNAYMRGFYLTHKESVLARNAAYRATHKDTIYDHDSLVKSDKRVQLRQSILDELGRRCVRCGFDEDVRALQVDHVNGDGAAERARLCTKFGSIRYYSNILDNVKSGNYQILCANCNTIKKYECGEFRKARGRI